MKQYQFLTPLKLPNGVTLKNRIVIPPMTERLALEDGTVSLNELDYLNKRSGGVGMFISPVANVNELGKGFEGELSAADDRFIPGLAKMAAVMKQGNSKAILQIFSAGRKTTSAILRGKQPVSASAVPGRREFNEMPHALTEAEVEQTIEDFAQAVRRAILAGFDGVEIHGANTYLIQQFFSPHSNRRTDQWGGDVMQRMRFALSIIKRSHEMIEQLGAKQFILGYRLSPEETEEPGIRIDDTLRFVDVLADQPLDYLHVSMGNLWRKSLNDPDEQRFTILRIKNQLRGRLPLIGVGSLKTPADVEKAMAAGIDLAAIGREYLVEPHWIEKVQAGREADIRYEVDPNDAEELGLYPPLMDFLTSGIPFPFKNHQQENGDDVFFSK
ncbi:NADH-dependent flavin oxidoreductase [Limosilactobacillus allomucosae]|uniref:NADH-dependent flavin oxidoreductase n=1 Tax=Limosilactobacillus allomucosae TaxID=3142938 RepID=UPI003263FA5A